MEFKYLRNVVSLELNTNLCNGCGLCIKVCPHAVFSLKNGKAQIDHRDSCMECGACALNCEQKAILVASGNGCGCATGIIEGFFTGDSECACSKGC